MVRFDKIATLDKGILIGRLGTADPLWLSRYRDVFFGVFGFDRPARGI
jgi:mRNA interferase MazF